MNILQVYSILIILALILTSCNQPQDMTSKSIPAYKPDDPELFKKIVALDKEYFDAYNTCDMAKQEAMYADNIEFYHDQGGLMTSKSDLLTALKNNICNKVTRELVTGSIEVYPIKGFGAVEIGYHKFHNKEEPDAPSHPSKFVTIWQNDQDNWVMSRVISLH